MPYQRRYRRRRRRYVPRKAPGQDRIGYALSTAMKALTVAKLAKSMLNVEYKHHDVSGQLTPNNTRTDVLLNGIAQGDSDTNRDGDTIRFKSIQVNGQVTQNASATNTLVKFYLVLDKQPNGAAPDGGAIFDSEGDPLSFRNVSYAKRFWIIKSWSMALDPEHQHKKFSFYKKINVRGMYTGSGATIGSIATNSIYLIACSDEATNTPTINYDVRLRYLDN